MCLILTGEESFSHRGEFLRRSRCGLLEQADDIQGLRVGVVRAPLQLAGILLHWCLPLGHVCSLARYPMLPAETMTMPGSDVLARKRDFIARVQRGLWLTVAAWELPSFAWAVRVQPCVTIARLDGRLTSF
ncbi:hypothetical protein ACWGPD_34115 [Streptomyces hirsutus]|uniref:hypothetical protein n=1 Tax=Streptomyces hirsutus TaxID=35620 RepID=UPI003633CFCE